METRRFERLRREVSRLGLAATGLYKRPDVDPAQVERAIGVAIDRGVNVLDTAPYLGESEQVCGEALRKLHAWERVALMTRVPPANFEWAQKDLLADDDGEAFRDPLPKLWPPAYLEDRVERSLKASKLEVLSVALLEGWHDSWLRSTAWPELEGAMARMQKKGKVLRWGLSLPLSAVPHTRKVLDEPIIAAVAAPYSLWSSAAEGLAAAAAERQVAFFAQQVMGQGGLSGEILATAEYPLKDVRRGIFGDEAMRVQLSKRVAELAAFTKSIPPAAQSSDAGREALEKSRRDLGPSGDGRSRDCETLAELAVRFAISAPFVACAVVGASSVAHVHANADAVERGPLPAHALDPVRDWMFRYVPPPPPRKREEEEG